MCALQGASVVRFARHQVASAVVRAHCRTVALSPSHCTPTRPRTLLSSGRRFPCVLIRTPYNKSAENADLRSPGSTWSKNGYACFIQDVRGRFASKGVFYKYTGEAQNGYDIVEWLAKQQWCNGCTDGPSYLSVDRGAARACTRQESGEEEDSRSEGE
jgi:hypothetical protein